MEQKVSETLQSAGIPPGINGFHYLKDAILLAYSDISYALKPSTKLYPTLGEKYNVPISNIERCIRFAITKTGRKISNGHFIAEYVEKLKYQ